MKRKGRKYRELIRIRGKAQGFGPIVCLVDRALVEPARILVYREPYI